MKSLRKAESLIGKHVGVVAIAIGLASFAALGTASADEKKTIDEKDFNEAIANEDAAVLREVCEKRTQVTSAKSQAMIERRAKQRRARGRSRGGRSRKALVYGGAGPKACKWLKSVETLKATSCDTVAKDAKVGYPNDRLRLAWAEKLIGCEQYEAFILQMGYGVTFELLGKKRADSALVAYLKRYRGKEFLRDSVLGTTEITKSLAKYYADHGGFRHCKLLLKAAKGASMTNIAGAFPLFAAGNCRKANAYAVDVLTNKTREATARRGYSKFTAEHACKMLAVTGGKKELKVVVEAAARNDTRYSKDRGVHKACAIAAKKIQKR